MLTAATACGILSQLSNVEPVLKVKEEKHRVHGLRFVLRGKAERHLVIKPRTTGGISVYVNRLSMEGVPFPEKMFPSITITRRYPKGHRGRTGEAGISNTAAGLATLNPLHNDVYLMKVMEAKDFEGLLTWYQDIPAATPAEIRLDGAIADAEEQWLDEESRVLVAAKTRRGQPAFRNALLKAYGGKCCMTGCAVEDVLEAAHIKSHAAETDYRVTNGLLLRGDVHTLFDVNLLGVDADYRIIVADSLMASEYAALHGRKLLLPANPKEWPSKKSLAARQAKEM